jgi:hypothetical protein
MTPPRENKADAPAKPMPGRTVHVVLTVLVALTAWLWFHFHVRRHVAGWAFGGVTAVAALAFAWMVWKSFVGDELKTLPQRWLAWRHTRVTLIVLLVVAVAAHLFTGSLHIDFDASNVRKAERVVADITRDGKVVKTVQVDAKHPEAVFTYMVGFTPVRVGVVTKAPRGYGNHTVDAGRFVRAIRLPDEASEKQYHLVRLAPGLNLFWLRGRAPDPDYTLEVFVNGRMVKRLDGIGFQPVYLGAAGDDLAAIPNLNGDARHRSDLNAFLGNLDASMPADARQKMIDDWVASPLFVDTPELQAGDSVRVVLAHLSVPSFDQIVKPQPRNELKTVFLTGVPEP